MMFSLYVTLGVFLLLAARDPSRSEPFRVNVVYVVHQERRRMEGKELSVLRRDFFRLCFCRLCRSNCEFGPRKQIRQPASWGGTTYTI
jgi:hypothetical protein